MNYLSLRLAGLLSLTVLTLGCGRSVLGPDPIGSNGSTSSSSAGAGGGSAMGGAGVTAGAGGSGAATSSSASGGVAVLACTNTGVSFASDIAPRLKEGCGGAGCHQGAFETPEGIYGYLVGQAAAQCPDGRLNVAPGDPEASYLIDKITNQDLCAGKPMPRAPGNGAWVPLPSEDIQAIYDWICSGAKDD
jgi:hypothetical protein